jgi:hypothetical protein
MVGAEHPPYKAGKLPQWKPHEAQSAAGDLLRVAKVAVRDINDALDLLLHPLRLKATLRD